MIFHEKNDQENAGQNMRLKIQSDHLVLATRINFNPMMSLKRPRIEKARLIKHIENFSKFHRRNLRENFFGEFMKIR